ncbi:MAG: hypothetical protein WAY93_10180 [Atopobiaceae bacterium]
MNVHSYDGILWHAPHPDAHLVCRRRDGFACSHPISVSAGADQVIVSCGYVA